MSTETVLTDLLIFDCLPLYPLCIICMYVYRSKAMQGEQIKITFQKKRLFVSHKANSYWPEYVCQSKEHIWAVGIVQYTFLFHVAIELKTAANRFR